MLTSEGILPQGVLLLTLFAHSASSFSVPPSFASFRPRIGSATQTTRMIASSPSRPAFKFDEDRENLEKSLKLAPSLDWFEIPQTSKQAPDTSHLLKNVFHERTSHSPVGTFLGLRGDKDRGEASKQSFQPQLGVHGRVADAEDLRLPCEKEETEELQKARERWARRSSLLSQALASSPRRRALLGGALSLLAALNRAALARLLHLTCALSLSLAALAFAAASVSRDARHVSGAGGGEGGAWHVRAYSQTAVMRRQGGKDMARLHRRLRRALLLLLPSPRRRLARR
mmetsp:Transcript_38562/g.91088  ORF Transcript_38562/g.91088 Transcript_38562/m.91088 type:complete len:286 (-) Transcript_38562:171-1028(-)